MKIKNFKTTKMLEEMSDLSTFAVRFAESNNCSTPIRESSTRSSVNTPFNDSAYQNLREWNTNIRVTHVVDSPINTNGFSQKEPIEISDESNDEGVVQNGQKMIKINDGGKRYLRVILNRMSPEYIRDRLNGVKSTQLTRTVITQTERSALRPEKLIKKSEKRDASEIDYKSWQWQPTLELVRLTKNDLQNQSKHSAVPIGDVPSIEFDDTDSSIIRELSPETAVQRFEERIGVIKQSLQPILMEPSGTKSKRSRVTKRVNIHQLEYEETHKRLQENAKKLRKNAKRTIGRKLYNPGDSWEDLVEKENNEPIDIEPKAKRAKVLTQNSVRILPSRSAKKIPLIGNK